MGVTSQFHAPSALAVLNMALCHARFKRPFGTREFFGAEPSVETLAYFHGVPPGRQFLSLQQALPIFCS